MKWCRFKNKFLDWKYKIGCRIRLPIYRKLMQYLFPWWDWINLLKVMREWLEDSSDKFIKYSIIADNKEVAEEMKRCKILIDRLLKDEYYDMYENMNWSKDKKWEREGQQQKQDKDYLLKIMKRKLFCWWD